METKQAFFKTIGQGLERALVPDARSKILAALGLTGTGGAGIYGYNSGFDTGKVEGLTEGKAKAMEEVRKRLADVLLGKPLAKAPGGLPKKASFMEKPAAKLVSTLLRHGAPNSLFARTIAQTPMGALGRIGRRFTSMNPGVGGSEFGLGMRELANNAIRDLKGVKSFNSILDDISGGLHPLVNSEGKAILNRRLAAANRLAKIRGFDSAEEMARFYFENPSLVSGAKNISKRLGKAVTDPVEAARRKGIRRGLRTADPVNYNPAYDITLTPEQVRLARRLRYERLKAERATTKGEAEVVSPSRAADVQPADEAVLTPAQRKAQVLKNIAQSRTAREARAKAITRPMRGAEQQAVKSPVVEAVEKALNTPTKRKPGFGTGLALGGGLGLPLAGGSYWLGSSRGYDRGYDKGGNEALQAGLNFGHYIARQQAAQNNADFLSRLGNLFTGNVSNFATPDFSNLTFADYLKQRDAAK